MIFWASLFVTVGAWIIRMKMAESPIFVELKKSVDVEHAAPLKEVAKHGTKNVLKVIFMNWGISTQSYTYQVFMASYLITFVGVDKHFVPNVLLYGALFGSLAAYLMGLLSDRFGRRRMFLILAGSAILIPFPAFMDAEHRIALLDHRGDGPRLHHRRAGHHRGHHELLPGVVRRPVSLRRRHPGPGVLRHHRRRGRPAGRRRPDGVVHQFLDPGRRLHGADHGRQLPGRPDRSGDRQPRPADPDRRAGRGGPTGSDRRAGAGHPQ